jgi:UDP-glucose 4-epimerase
MPAPVTTDATSDRRFFIVGGAGFIGSHFCDHLLGPGEAAAVTIFDNFSSGRAWHHAQHAEDPRFRIARGDAEDTIALAAAMEGHDVVIHLASNPDIARAANEPTIDFTQGTALTSSVLEAMRITGAKRILYASGSGVYGELGTHEAGEDHGPLVPISTYGASKLAGEALISSYAYMFGISGCAFRFGNVVGPRQTHGVGFDFARKLVAAEAEGDDPIVLRILGDGTQSKSYIHVEDVVRAVMTAHELTIAPFAVYNVATGDYITVSEIAAVAIECVGLDPTAVQLDYTGGDRGWKGDVPVIRLATERIRALGWRCLSGSREALRRSIAAMIPDMKAGRM